MRMSGQHHKVGKKSVVSEAAKPRTEFQLCHFLVRGLRASYYECGYSSSLMKGSYKICKPWLKGLARTREWGETRKGESKTKTKSKGLKDAKYE